MFSGSRFISVLRNVPDEDPTQVYEKSVGTENEVLYHCDVHDALDDS